MPNITYAPFTLTINELSRAAILKKRVAALFHLIKNYKKQFLKLRNVSVQSNTNKTTILIYIRRLAKKVQVACFVFQTFFCSVGCRSPPSEFWYSIKIQNSEERQMENKKKYIINSCGQAFEVNKETYDAYYVGGRKERYFSVDLKTERIKVSKDGKVITTIPSREDSYERLLETEKQFPTDFKSVEDIAISAVMLEKLPDCLKHLTSEEWNIIEELFYKDTSEVQLAKQLGLARTTLQSKKYRILDKLKNLL